MQKTLIENSKLKFIISRKQNHARSAQNKDFGTSPARFFIYLFITIIIKYNYIFYYLLN